MEDTMINQEHTPSLEINDSKNEKSNERKKFFRRPDLDVMTRLESISYDLKFFC